MDGLISKERNAFKPHCLYTITIREVFVVIAARRGGLGRCYKESAVSQGTGKQAARNIKHRAPKTILKYY
jgi:hypothetical protein